MKLKDRADHYWSIYTAEKRGNLKLTEEISKLKSDLNKSNADLKLAQEHLTKVHAKFSLLKNIIAPHYLKCTR